MSVERYIPQVGDRVRLPHWQRTVTVTAVGEHNLLARGDGFTFEEQYHLQLPWELA